MLEVACGIGRVSQALFKPLVKEIHLLELNSSYLEKAISFVDSLKVTRRFCCSMEDFGRDEHNRVGVGKYKLIWVQWAIIYLNDFDFIQFLKKCRKCLKEKGMVVVKDNVASEGFFVDREDMSILRCRSYMKELFGEGGFVVVKEGELEGFPEGMFETVAFALAPTYG